MPGHALLKALAATLALSLVLPGAHAGSLRGLQAEAPAAALAPGLAAAPDAGPADAPALAPLPSYERLPAGNVSARSIIDDVWELVESIGEQAIDFVVGGVCVYGSNCVSNCISESWWPGDELDEACHWHDRCLEASSDRCACHQDLQDIADEIASRPDKCRWWKFLSCTESKMLSTAPSISLAINVIKAMDGC